MRLFAAACVLIVGTLSSAAVCGAEGPTVDPEAEALLRKLLAEPASEVRTDATLTLDLKAPGVSRKITANYTVAAEKPNRVSAVSRTKDAPQVVCDGQQLYVLLSDAHKYVLGDAPANLAAVVNDVNVRTAALAAPLLRTALTRVLTYEELIAGTTEVRHAGPARLGAARCEKVLLITDAYDLEFWIDQEDPTRLRKVEVDVGKLLAETLGDKLPPGLVCSGTLILKKPRSEQISAADFAIQPATDAEKVATLALPKPVGPSSLLGQAAPPVRLALLDGGTMDLANHAGKEVVILDFWATWCGPCVASLPQLAQVAAAYRSRGVAFYAVNLREDSAPITKFLQEKQLVNMPVALDTDGRTASQYRVGGIPMTVIIGKDGTVQVVHVGASPDLQAQLARELDALLAGQRLAP